jgi:hypothetical protein
MTALDATASVVAMILVLYCYLRAVEARRR